MESGGIIPGIYKPKGPKTKMGRRRINKSAPDREVGLLGRAVAVFTTDLELRVCDVKKIAF